MDNPDLIIKLISGNSAAIWTGVITLMIGFAGLIVSVGVAIYNARVSFNVKKAEFESSHHLQEMEFEEKKRVNQTQVYWEWLASLQDFMNAPEKPATFTLFQKTTMKVIVQGEDKLARCMRDYYFDIIQIIIKADKNADNSSIHEKYQREIINLMRLAQNMEEVGNIHLVIFSPKNK